MLSDEQAKGMKVALAVGVLVGVNEGVLVKVGVIVKVEVDVAGNVTEVKVESAGPSKYFLRIAVEAARGWKFSTAQSKQSGAREWRLQFAFSRAKTEARATAVND